MEVFLQWLDDLDDMVLAIGQGLISAEARLAGWMGAGIAAVAVLMLALGAGG